MCDTPLAPLSQSVAIRLVQHGATRGMQQELPAWLYRVSLEELQDFDRGPEAERDIRDWLRAFVDPSQEADEFPCEFFGLATLYLLDGNAKILAEVDQILAQGGHAFLSLEIRDTDYVWMAGETVPDGAKH